MRIGSSAGAAPAQTRPVGEQTFDTPQGLEESKFQAPRERREQTYTSCRAAIRGGHRLISPRRSDTRTSSVNVFIEASRAKTVRAPSQEERARPGDGASSTVIRISSPRPKTMGRGRAVAGCARDRHAAHACVCRRETASGMSASTRSA